MDQVATIVITAFQMPILTNTILEYALSTTMGMIALTILDLAIRYVALVMGQMLMIVFLAWNTQVQTRMVNAPANSIGMVLIVRLMLENVIITAYNVLAQILATAHNVSRMLNLIPMGFAFALITTRDMPAPSIQGNATIDVSVASVEATSNVMSAYETHSAPKKASVNVMPNGEMKIVAYMQDNAIQHVP